MTSQGAEFETLMRTRMASLDLPDMWTTHGWSVERYSEYLRPQRPALDRRYHRIDARPLYPTMKAKSSSAHRLGSSRHRGQQDRFGAGRRGLLRPAPGTISGDAFEKVKRAVRHRPGFLRRDPQLFARSRFGLALVVYHQSCHDYSEQPLDGTFDWSRWGTANELLLEMKEKRLHES